MSHILCRTYLQHPLEVKRPLRTVPLLEAALESCHVFRTRKLNDPKKLPKLEKLLSDKSPYVLFPSEGAIPCEELPSNAAIIAIDGTWRQARSILHNVVGFIDSVIDSKPKHSRFLRILPSAQKHMEP